MEYLMPKFFRADRTCSLLAFMGVTSFLLAGCASDTFGDRLVERGETEINLGEQWLEGQELIKEGNEEIEEGSEAVREGQEKVKRGKEMVEEVERLRGKRTS
jgi:hypothetical protein